MPPEQKESATAFECARVTLNQIRPNLGQGDIAKRTVLLTSERPSLKIGRSSKTLSKGLVPGADNGYFDSPVVSRSHAEILVDLAEGIIRVKDLDSLHGTSINDTSVPRGETPVLKTGDVLCFGIHVSRGLDIFDPVVCEVDIESLPIVPPAERARSYCAPESVDDGLSDVESETADVNDPNADAPQHRDDQASPASEAGDVTVGQEIGFKEIEAAKAADGHSRSRNSYSAEYVAGFESDGSHSDSPGPGNDVDMDDDDDDDDDDDYGDVGDSEDSDDMDDDEDEELEDLEELEESEEPEDFEDSEDPEETAFDAVVRSDGGEDEDGSALLAREIRQYADENKDATLRPAERVLPVHGEPDQGRAISVKEGSLPAHGLRTPPSGSAKDSPVSDHAVEEDGVREQGQANGLASTAPPTNKKIDISSILNPSPPRSSPVRDSSSLSYGSGENAHGCAQRSFRPPTVASHVHASLGMPPVSMEALSEESLIWASSYSSEEGGRARVPNVSAAAAANAGEAVTTGVPEEPSDGAIPAVEAEAGKATKKRKADAMLEGSAGARPASDATERRTAAQPDDNHVDKRQATAPAVAARMKATGRAWAAVERIGIAALGGAVVLGSLIYTAPSF